MLIDSNDLEDKSVGRLTSEQKARDAIALQNALNRSNMTDKNEIKKELYRQKEDAKLDKIDKDGIHYTCKLLEMGFVSFTVPFKDIEDGRFYESMPSQYLIRWMVTPEKV